MSISQKSNLASTTRQQINKHDQQTTRSANIISKGFPLPHHPIRALHCRVRVPTANRRPIYSPLRLRIKDWLPGCLFSVRPTSHRARMGKTAHGVSPTGTDAANPSAAPAQTLQSCVQDGKAARGVSPKGTDAASPRVRPALHGVSPTGTTAAAGWTHLPAPLTATLFCPACWPQLSSMQTRSGKKLVANFLRKIRLLPPQPELPIQTSVSVDELIHAASDLQDRWFMEGRDDAEGIELSSRPSSPFTEHEPSVAGEDTNAVWESPQSLGVKRHMEFEPSVPGTSSGGKRSRNEEDDSNTAPCALNKDRGKLSSNKRCSKKRIAKAQSAHPATSYAAKPSVVERLPTLPPLTTSVDAQKLPKSLEGSWIGKRVTHDRDTPWTLDELRQQGFQVVEWDGWWVTAEPFFQLLLTRCAAHVE